MRLIDRLARFIAHVWRVCHNATARRALFAMVMLTCFKLACCAGDSDSPGGRSRPPVFSGDRVNFTQWLISFTVWLALHEPDLTDIMEGDEPEPQLPNAADPAITAEQIADATALQLNWRKRNKKLFGALGTGVPEYIRTSLYTSDRNDGVSSLTYLRTHYDSRDGDGNDRASALQRLQASYIDSRNDLSENDVHHQHDNIMISVRDIVSAGGARPDELLLISMFENSVPIAYSTIRQMTRRMNHTTLLGYYQDLLSQTRAELASRAPAIHAFAAGGASRDDGDDSVQALAAMGLQRIAPPPSPGHLGGGRGSAKDAALTVPAVGVAPPIPEHHQEDTQQTRACAAAKPTAAPTAQNHQFHADCAQPTTPHHTARRTRPQAPSARLCHRAHALCWTAKLAVHPHRPTLQLPPWRLQLQRRACQKPPHTQPPPPPPQHRPTMSRRLTPTLQRCACWGTTCAPPL